MVKLFQNFLKGNKITHIALKTLLSHNVYRKKYTFLKQSQTWDKKQTEEYQIKQLKNLLHHAYENVPYYNKLFKKAGLKPRDVSSIDDLKKLPFLTKQIVQENRKDLKAQNYPEYKFDYIKTGGSTGFPLGVYMEKGVAQATYLAFFQTLLDQANCHLMDKQVSLTGFDSVFKYQIFRRVLALSSFHTKDEDLSLYAKKIRKFKPKFILAYPSAIVTLAKFMNKNKISFPPSIKMVICSGETLFDWQRELLEKTFNCRVYALYAHTEVSVFATTCRYSYNYHVYPEYGITEIVHKDGTPVNKEGEIGEIVTTGFNNFIFPFIRYRTGDLGVVTYQKCRCGRDYMLLKNIIGRVQELIVTKEKRYIPLTGGYGLVAWSSENVKNCQLIQEKEGELILNIVKDKNYTSKDEKLIKDNFSKKFDDKLILKIRYVDEIPLTPGGKSRFLIQKLPVEY